MSRADATAAARRAFGNVTNVVEQGARSLGVAVHRIVRDGCALCAAAASPNARAVGDRHAHPGDRDRRDDDRLQLGALRPPQSAAGRRQRRSHHGTRDDDVVRQLDAHLVARLPRFSAVPQIVRRTGRRVPDVHCVRRRRARRTSARRARVGELLRRAARPTRARSVVPAQSRRLRRKSADDRHWLRPLENAFSRRFVDSRPRGARQRVSVLDHRRRAAVLPRVDARGGDRHLGAGRDARTDRAHRRAGGSRIAAREHFACSPASPTA